MLEKAVIQGDEIFIYVNEQLYETCEGKLFEYSKFRKVERLDE